MFSSLAQLYKMNAGNVKKTDLCRQKCEQNDNRKQTREYLQ